MAFAMNPARTLLIGCGLIPMSAASGPARLAADPRRDLPAANEEHADWACRDAYAERTDMMVAGTSPWIPRSGEIATSSVMDGLDETRGTPSAIERARQQTEERQRVSEARCRLLAENASDVSWTMSLDGRITEISPSVECCTRWLSSAAIDTTETASWRIATR
jgi:PAS domain-containing protein